MLSIAQEIQLEFEQSLEQTTTPFSVLVFICFPRFFFPAGLSWLRSLCFLWGISLLRPVDFCVMGSLLHSMTLRKGVLVSLVTQQVCTRFQQPSGSRTRPHHLRRWQSIPASAQIVLRPADVGTHTQTKRNKEAKHQKQRKEENQAPWHPTQPPPPPQPTKTTPKGEEKGTEWQEDRWSESIGRIDCLRCPCGCGANDFKKKLKKKRKKKKVNKNLKKQLLFFRSFGLLLLTF